MFDDVIFSNYLIFFIIIYDIFIDNDLLFIHNSTNKKSEKRGRVITK